MIFESSFLSGTSPQIETDVRNRKGRMKRNERRRAWLFYPELFTVRLATTLNVPERANTT